MKAAEIEDAQKAEIEKLKEDKDAAASAAIAAAVVGNIFGSFDSDAEKVQLDTFIPADRRWQTAIAVGLGTNALLGYASDDFLSRLFPSFVLAFRNYLGQGLIRSIFRWAVVLHLVEGSIGLLICLKRGWYSPVNVLKWTTSTLLYGFASLMKLSEHGKKVEKAVKKDN